MTSILPTALAVASAISYYRTLRDLTCDEMSQLLLMHGHDLTAESIDHMERGVRVVGVDDLVAIAAVLDLTPADLLGYTPGLPDFPEDAPLGTGLPEDLAPGELADWLRGRLQLDDASRAAWWAEQEARLEVLYAHLVDQLEAAVEELRSSDVGEWGEARSIGLLQSWIRSGDLAVHDVGCQLDVVGMRIDQLRGPR